MPSHWTPELTAGAEEDDMADMYCVMTIDPYGVARTGLYSESCPTTAQPRIVRCLAGPLAPHDMTAWLAGSPEGRVAEGLLDERSREWMREITLPRIDDHESTRLVVEHLSRPAQDGRVDLIGAIKLLRERCRATGCGLREAKDRVDHVWATLRSLGMGR